MFNPFKENIDQKLDDRHFITKALNGDAEALESLILRHQSWIFNIALNMTGDVHNAQDATQEVLIKMITKLSSYDPGISAFRTWLYRIVLNHVLSMKENQKEKVMSGFAARALDTDWIDLEPDRRKASRPDYAVIAEETKISCILCTLLSLNRRDRFIFILGGILGVGDDVGSEICGITRSNFRKIVSRSRKNIYGFFDKNCSLLKENNPCKCGKQSTLMIKAGLFDPANPVLEQDSLGTIREMLGTAVSAMEGCYYEFNALFSDQPFLKGPDMVKWLRDTLKRNDMQSLLSLN